MFTKKRKLLNPNITDTLIGESTLIEGHVKSEASIRIEGQITGGVDCAGDVIVGERGKITSHVTARNIILAGSVHGNIAAKGKLTITSTGSLYGDISTTAFTVEEGGLFQGTSRMAPKAAESSADAEIPYSDKPVAI